MHAWESYEPRQQSTEQPSAIAESGCLSQQTYLVEIGRKHMWLSVTTQKLWAAVVDDDQNDVVVVRAVAAIHAAHEKQAYPE